MFLHGTIIPGVITISLQTLSSTFSYLIESHLTMRIAFTILSHIIPAWSPDSWQTKPLAQGVDYADCAHLQRTLAELAALPPLVGRSSEADLGKAYLSDVDSRLNYEQALEIAASIARRTENSRK